MPTFNRILLLGHLGDDPEVRPTGSGRTLTKLRLATNHRWRDDRDEWQEETDWHSVVLFGPAAERVQRRARKGDLVLVEGRLRMRIWKADDGSRRQSPEVQARRVQVLGRFLPTAGLEEGAGQRGADGPAGDEDIPF